MFHQRGCLPVFRVIALQSLHKGNCQPGCQKWILTVALFRPAPAHIPSKIGIWCKDNQSRSAIVRILCKPACLLGLEGGDLVQQLRIPHLGEAVSLRERSGNRTALASHRPVGRAAHRKPVKALHQPVALYSQAGHRRPGGEAVDLFIEVHQANEIVYPFFIIEAGVIERPGL